MKNKIIEILNNTLIACYGGSDYTSLEIAGINTAVDKITIAVLEDKIKLTKQYHQTISEIHETLKEDDKKAKKLMKILAKSKQQIVNLTTELFELKLK